MKNGQTVAAFERAFADYVGAKYAIALCNGTATLHTALVALGVKPGDWVAVPPLTMASTTIAVLHAGAVPVFADVDRMTWLMAGSVTRPAMAVSLFGLSVIRCNLDIDDAAQTLRKHSGAAFTSYSFQASKILPLGEGGMLVTNDETLATKAREFSSLGYRMKPDQPRIDPDTLKSPTFERHHSLGWNYRMNDLTAEAGLARLAWADKLLERRKACADLYHQAHQGCRWLTPQHVPEGWTHDYWCYPLLIDQPSSWGDFGGGASGKDFRILGSLNVPFNLISKKIVAHGGERPYACWKLTYQEPAFRHLAPNGTCPVAESLQPRLMLFQTNDLHSAEKNAHALKLAIADLS